jgi:DNA-binding NtrC family response regulator
MKPTPKPPKPPLTLSDLLALHERLLIVQTLSRHDFSRKRAAEALGITRLDLWRRMRKLKIDVKRTSPGRPSKTVKEN